MDSGRQAWLQVRVGEVCIAIDPVDPVAVVRAPDAEEITASWPDLDTGARAVSCTVVGAPTGAWVLYRPLESEDDDFPAGRTAAVHVAPDGKVTRVTGIPDGWPAGASRRGLWLTSDPFPDPRDEEAWRRLQHGTILLPTGGSRGFTVDRRIASVLDDGERAHVVLYAGAPIVHRRGRGGAGYEYRYQLASLPAADDESVSDLRTAELQPRPTDAQELMQIMEEWVPQPVEPTPDHGVTWALVELPESDREFAVASVVREFADLETYWQAPDGRASPLASGLGDARVDVVGAWPDTRVEVSFTHPRLPGGRLRRSIRVFDDAGRAVPALYASIHLMEDLATGHLPDAGAARDGILDI